MFDSHHGDAKPSGLTDVGSDRDVKVDQLLRAGLEHYFKYHNAWAIDVWSSVLFLGCVHAVYLEHVRAALTECLRKSKEPLHGWAEAFSCWDLLHARELATLPVDRGGSRDEVSAF